ncbi:ABC transporter permease [Salinarimonas sp.]|uniref:ABC transporter permease n=1 Tax=Salinarimonas sp. TaxID=2766526 RepID=UPI00391B7373
MRNVTVAALVVIVALPLAFVVLQAIFPFIGRGSLAEPLSRVLPVLADPDLVRLTGNTLLLGIACVIGAAILAVPLGALRALFAVPFARVFDVVFLTPFMIPPYIAALGWIMMLQPRGYLHQIAGFHLAPFLFSFWGGVFVMVLNVFPVVYFATSRTLAIVGGRYGEIARVFGADPATAFRRITLPLATPGLAASLLLVFAMAIEEYGTPAALGARAGFFVLVTGIDTRVSDWPIDLPGAAILSLVLVLLSVGAFWLQLRIVARRSFETVSGKPQPAVPRPLGRWRWPVLAYFLLAALLGTGLPLFAIVTAGLQNTISGGLALSNLGLQHFAAIAENRSGALRALTNSLALGIGTALLAGILGAAASYQVVRARLRGGAALDALTLMPNAMPSIVVAVGLILAWNNPLWPASPYNTPAILLLAYTCILLPYTVRYANAAFRQIGTSVEDAARVAGASPVTVFRRILLPLVAPSMIAAMLIVFAIASRELVASLLVAPVGMPTVATFIWRQFEQGSLGLGMAMSALAILVTTTIPVLVILAMRRRGAVDF